MEVVCATSRLIFLFFGGLSTIDIGSIGGNWGVALFLLQILPVSQSESGGVSQGGNLLRYETSTSMRLEPKFYETITGLRQN